MTRTLAAALSGLLGCALLVLGPGLLTPAGAIPSGGAGPDTPGTSSSLTGSRVQAGGSLGFTVRGYPGGETLYIKIDDEQFCSSPPFGACVYHQQAIPASGTVTGSITLPAGLGAGRHTLRFLASATGNSGELIGYTRRSPAFTVVAAASGSSGTADAGGSGGSRTSGDGGSGSAGDSGSGTSGGAGTSGTTSGTTDPGTTDPGAAGAAPGEGTVLSAPGAAGAPGTAVPESTAPATAAPVLAAPQVQAATDDDLVPMPWIGLYVLLGCLLVSSLMTMIAIVRRR